MIHTVLTRGTKYLQLIRQAEHGGSERHLQEERVTLTRFDTELRELDEVIKAKKQAASGAEVAIKTLEHQEQALAKEKASHVTSATNLEKQDEWIAEESQPVKEPATVDVLTNSADAHVSQQTVWPIGIVV